MGWYRYERHERRRPADGIRAQSGQFGKTWWAGKWLAALERLIDSARLSRGRSYARGGQVLDIDIETGWVGARVQGSRPMPYRVTIKITPLSPADWERVADAMSAQAIFAAKLLAGEMPQDIEEAFAASKVSLFPDKAGDLVTECSCPDWANPCKHVAAVYLLLGERFDADPFLLFRLRGKTKEEVMAMLRSRRGALAPAMPQPEAVSMVPEESEPATPLADCLDHFWDTSDDLSEMRYTFRAPEVDAIPVKRLGTPNFWQSRTDFAAFFTRVYSQVTAAALQSALGNPIASDGGQVLLERT